jgi:hypothetical protein
MSRLLALSTLALFALAFIGAGGPVSGAQRSAGYRYGALAPAGWHEARRTLVPKLLMPREVLSLGTFGMRPGGGGDCGREPVAALAAMRRGDSLLTVQEYAVTAKMRRHLGRRYPPLPAHPRLPRLERAWPLPGPPLLRATVTFSDHGRVFDALLYFRARPDAALRRQALMALAGVRFGEL